MSKSHFLIILMLLTMQTTVAYTTESNSSTTIRGIISRISNSSTGNRADEGADKALISEDGRYIIYMSGSTNLIDTPSEGYQVYKYDRELDELELVSISNNGDPANSGVRRLHFPSMSYDGRYVSFESTSNNLVEGDNDGDSNDLFIRDTVLDQTTIIAAAMDDSLNALKDANEASIAGNGEYIVFVSEADSFVDNDNNTV